MNELRKKIVETLEASTNLDWTAVADRILTLLPTESEAVAQYLASVEEVDPPL